MRHFITVIVLTVIVIVSLSSAIADDQSYYGKDLGFGPSYIKDTIPDRLQPGHSYPVMITFKNTGLVIWESRTHRVGLVYGGDLASVVTIPAFVEIPVNSTVSPGKEVTFAFSLLPVGLPGDYTLPFYVSYRSAQGDNPVTETFKKKITIVPTDGISSPQNGSMVVESTLADLEVSLGGISMGKTPCIIPDLNPGSYTVEIRSSSFERSIPVQVERASLSRVFIDNPTTEPKIELVKVGIVSDGTLFGYIDANIPLIVIVSLFIIGCIVVMIHGVRLRREGEEGEGKKKGRKQKKSDEDPAKQEKDLLDQYHSKPPLFDEVPPASDPGSGSSTGGMKLHEAPKGPMKNVRKFSRDMLEVNQEGSGEKTGGMGGLGSQNASDSTEGAVELSLKELEIKPGSARAHITASNQTTGSLSVEGIQVGAGISVDIPVEIPEPVTDEYEMTISLKILNNLGHSFYQHLQIPYNRGIALLARGILEKAYDYYQGVTQKNPRQIDALLKKAKILFDWGLEEEAEEILDHILEIVPDHEEALAASRQIVEQRKKKEEEKIKVREKTKIAGFPDSLYDRYTPIRFLGKDAFASIILVLRNDTGDLRALKIAHEGVEVGSSVFTEISVMYQLRHPNVLKMFRAEYNPNLFLELEYVSGVTIEENLCRTLADLKHPVPKDVVDSLIEGIALGISYLHSKGVRHYHLSPRYILLDEPMIPKISGLIRNTVIPTRNGNEDLMIVRAPEQMHPEKFGKPGKKTDIFQMGVIWYWLMTGTIPYQGGSIYEGDQNTILSGVYVSPGIIHPEYSPYDQMMWKLLALDKRDRYGSVSEFLADLWGIHMGDTVSEADGSENNESQ